MPLTDSQAKRYLNLHFSYFNGPDDGVIEFQRVRIVKTRKPHNCCSVDPHEIPSGTECVADSAKYDGEVGTCWICFPCLDKWAKQIDWD